MKKLLLLLFTAVAIISSCKEKESDRFIFLTGTVWTPVSLMADGVMPETLPVNFKGDARFNKDGTGTFGTYTEPGISMSQKHKLFYQLRPDYSNYCQHS